VRLYGNVIVVIYDKDTITRELQEELGLTVRDVQEIGTVVQYRNILDKKYMTNGYTAELETIGGLTDDEITNYFYSP
jgi:8-oxo-dGTP pyrophosphatase MutT (NUDIX family)